MNKILIANRGEIALRIMRSAKEMGIKTVAVFSEADRNALHTQFADEAVCIGAAPSSQSYLLGDKIIEVCLQTGAQGIHPGYGFLSENAGFADKVKQAGLIFIGPSAESMRMMGSKLAAKETAKKFGVPLVPGIDEAITDINKAKQTATEIGFPVLIKASAGGGGKGMRVVNNESEFEEQMNMAVSEAISSFGDGAVFIEKYVASPRHIEVQVLGDNYGNVVHLFERECSVQRRHQKLIEEAPSSILTHDLRMRIGKSAVDAAKACNYSGAGTVEFLVDENLNYYFLEMNTRLQVEHPVTELITGIDLVKEQIKIARGEKLSFKQEDLQIRGHAMELRVCAEDPMNNFLPDTGTLETYKRPQGNGVRVDDGFDEGMSIPIYYDPMIAKLICYGANRSDVISKLIRAIDEYKISGVKTTLQFGKWVLQNNDFISGNFDTHFIQKNFKPEYLQAEVTEEEYLIGSLIAAQLIDSSSASGITDSLESSSESMWRRNRTDYH